jgi:FtsZ-binding cell division protein ZapB
MTTNPDNAKPHSEANATMVTNPGYAMTPAEALETPKETQENTKTPFDEFMELSSILLLKIDSFRDENEDLHDENQNLRDETQDLCGKILAQVLNSAALTTISTPYDLCMELYSLHDENDYLRGKNEDLRAKLKKEDLKPRPPMLRRSMKLALLLLGVCVFLIFLPPMITPVHRNALETPAEALETAKKKQQDGINVPTYEAMDIKTPADEAMELLQAVLRHSQFTNEELRDENEELRDENQDLLGTNEDLRDKLKVHEDSMPQSFGHLCLSCAYFSQRGV